MLCALIIHISSADLQFKIDSERQICTVNKIYSLQLCADCAKQFVSNAQNCGKTNHGFSIVITHQLTDRCLCVSFWPKKQNLNHASITHRIHRNWPPLNFSSSQDWRQRWKESVLLWLRKYKQNRRSCWRYQKAYFRSVSRIGKNADTSILYQRGVIVK